MGTVRIRDARLVAAIDCGSGGLRATIAEIRGEECRVLEECRRDIDLSAAFGGGRLDRRTMDALAAAAIDLRDLMAGYGVSEVRAVGTAAFREASNVDVFLEGLRRQGLAVTVIDGAEETRLYFEALRFLIKREGQEPWRGTTLMVDIGRGSAVVGLIRDDKLMHAVDERFGTHRTVEDLAGLRDSLEFCRAVDRLASGAVTVLLRRLPPGSIDTLVVNGPEVRLLLALLQGDQGGPFRRLEGARLRGWFQAVEGLSPALRGQYCGCDQASAEQMVPAACLIACLCERTGIEAVTVPQIDLRDGILASFMPWSLGPHHLPPAHLLAAARQLAARYGMDLAYSENTAALATQIFDQSQDLHHLGRRERTLLAFAALIHDIGASVNVRSRHKHTFYLVRASDLAGLSHREKAVIAFVGRYHRGAGPRPTHVDFMALPRRVRVLISHLSAILRLAYALDVERNQRIRKVRCRLDGHRFLMCVDRRDIALERWSLARKADLFTEVFGLEVVLLPREED